jgi:hypothetical protein
LPKQYVISGLATNNIYTSRAQVLNVYAVKNNGQKVLLQVLHLSFRQDFRK